MNSTGPVKSTFLWSKGLGTYPTLFLLEVRLVTFSLSPDPLQLKMQDVTAHLKLPFPYYQQALELLGLIHFLHPEIIPENLDAS